MRAGRVFAQLQRLVRGQVGLVSGDFDVRVVFLELGRELCNRRLVAGVVQGQVGPVSCELPRASTSNSIPASAKTKSGDQNRGCLPSRRARHQRKTSVQFVWRRHAVVEGVQWLGTHDGSTVVLYFNFGSQSSHGGAQAQSGRAGLIRWIGVPLRGRESVQRRAPSANIYFCCRVGL